MILSSLKQLPVAVRAGVVGVSASIEVILELVRRVGVMVSVIIIS